MVNTGTLAKLAPHSRFPFRVPIGFPKPLARAFGSRVDKQLLWRAVGEAFGARERTSFAGGASANREVWKTREFSTYLTVGFLAPGWRGGGSAYAIPYSRPVVPKVCFVRCNWDGLSNQHWGCPRWLCGDFASHRPAVSHFQGCGI